LKILSSKRVRGRRQGWRQYVVRDSRFLSILRKAAKMQGGRTRERRVVRESKKDVVVLAGKVNIMLPLAL